MPSRVRAASDNERIIAALSQASKNVSICRFLSIRSLTLPVLTLLTSQMRIKLIILALAISVAPFKAMAQRRAIPVDVIIRGGTVVTMDGSRRVIDNGGVAVKDGRVVAVGASAEMDLNYSS